MDLPEKSRYFRTCVTSSSLLYRDLITCMNMLLALFEGRGSKFSRMTQGLRERQRGRERPRRIKVDGNLSFYVDQRSGSRQGIRFAKYTIFYERRHNTLPSLPYLRALKIIRFHCRGEVRFDFGYAGQKKERCTLDYSIISGALKHLSPVKLQLQDCRSNTKQKPVRSTLLFGKYSVILGREGTKKIYLISPILC